MKDSDVFSRKIETKVARKMKAQKESKQTLWVGFSMAGLVGWSVSIPILLGIALGVFLDKHFFVGHSWTLLFLMVGLIVGCFNAWYWVSKEEQAIRKKEEDSHE